MENLFVKDLSKLTGVSVQTLHYYDRINLLKPSIRLTNGYRGYSRNDLLCLQQIIALKFFGFELSQIKKLLTHDDQSLEHFIIQAELLEKKANSLLEASKTLSNIVAEIKDNKSVSLETIIKLIEVYHMTQELEHAWVSKIFTPEELKEYANFERGLRANSEQEQEFKKNWDKIVVAIEKHLDHDPSSIIGIELGEKCMALINGLYGKKYAHLRTKIFEQGFGEGIGLDAVGLTPDSVSWLDKAVNAYWRNRAYNILAQVGKESSSKILSQWNEMLDEMYGNSIDRRNVVQDIALKDDKVSEAAKKWLKSI